MQINFGTQMGASFCFQNRKEFANQLCSILNNLSQTSMVAAKRLAEFVSKKLKKSTDVELPVWLKAIRDDDAARFITWFSTSDSPTESFQDRNFPRPRSARFAFPSEFGASYWKNRESHLSALVR